MRAVLQLSGWERHLLSISERRPQSPAQTDGLYTLWLCLGRSEGLAEWFCLVQSESLML